MEAILTEIKDQINRKYGLARVDTNAAIIELAGGKRDAYMVALIARSRHNEDNMAHVGHNKSEEFHCRIT